MPICYFCQQYTHVDAKDPQAEELHCHNCGKVIMSKGKLILAPSENQTAEKLGSKEKINPGYIPYLSFLLGAVVATACSSYYFSQKTADFSPHQENVVPQVAVDSQEKEPDLIEVAPVKNNSMNLLLEEGVFFGATVEEVAEISPSLFALREGGKHYALFETGLFFDLGQRIELDNVFYFFDESDLLESVEYVLPYGEGVEDSSLLATITQELNLRYEVIFETVDYCIWEAVDGLIGLHKTQMFLHFSDDDVRMNSIFKETHSES